MKNTRVIVNAGVTPEEGAQLVGDGKTDAISIGFQHITHPDLTNRVKNGRTLDNAPNMAGLYWDKNQDPAFGYTDYPDAVSVQA